MAPWLLTRLASTHFCTVARHPVPLLPPRKLVISTGSSSTELAKMIGMTPLWLTFNGM